MNHIPLPTAIVVVITMLLLGVLAYMGVPGTAVALTGMAGSVIAALMKGVQSAPEILREYSMRPPPKGPTETIEVHVPSFAPPPVIENKGETDVPR